MGNAPQLPLLPNKLPSFLHLLSCLRVGQYLQKSLIKQLHRSDFHQVRVRHHMPSTSIKSEVHPD